MPGPDYALPRYHGVPGWGAYMSDNKPTAPLDLSAFDDLDTPPSLPAVAVPVAVPVPAGLVMTEDPSAATSATGNPGWRMSLTAVKKA